VTYYTLHEPGPNNGWRFAAGQPAWSPPSRNEAVLGANSAAHALARRCAHYDESPRWSVPVRYLTIISPGARFERALRDPFAAAVIGS
jgi:hypothetical protein